MEPAGRPILTSTAQEESERIHAYASQFDDDTMALAQLALVARQTGDLARAAALAREAYGLEAQAAGLVPDGADSGPTRSISYRSAAWLALQANLPDEALRLAEHGLAGSPPALIAAELEEALATARLKIQAHAEDGV